VYLLYDDVIVAAIVFVFSLFFVVLVVVLVFVFFCLSVYLCFCSFFGGQLWWASAYTGSQPLSNLSLANKLRSYFRIYSMDVI